MTKSKIKLFQAGGSLVILEYSPLGQYFGHVLAIGEHKRRPKIAHRLTYAERDIIENKSNTKLYCTFLKHLI